MEGKAGGLAIRAWTICASHARVRWLMLQHVLGSNGRDFQAWCFVGEHGELTHQKFLNEWRWPRLTATIGNPLICRHQ